jgi:hypothetical protein
MHNFDGIVCILLTFKLYKTISLMLISDFISWNMDVNNGSALCKKLPNNILCNFLINITDIDSCLLISLIYWGNNWHNIYFLKSIIKLILLASNIHIISVIYVPYKHHIFSIYSTFFIILSPPHFYYYYLYYINHYVFKKSLESNILIRYLVTKIW